MYYLCSTRKKLRGFFLFLGSKNAKMTSKVDFFSSNIGETIFDVVSPTLHIIIFTLNFALKTSYFKQNTTFLKILVFLKQNKEQRFLEYNLQSTTTIRMALLSTCHLVYLLTNAYRVQLPSGEYSNMQACE